MPDQLSGDLRAFGEPLARNVDQDPAPPPPPCEDFASGKPGPDVPDNPSLASTDDFLAGLVGSSLELEGRAHGLFSQDFMWQNAAPATRRRRTPTQPGAGNRPES